MRCFWPRSSACKSTVSEDLEISPLKPHLGWSPRSQLKYTNAGKVEAQSVDEFKQRLKLLLEDVQFLNKLSKD